MLLGADVGGVVRFFWVGGGNTTPAAIIASIKTCPRK